MKKLLVLMSSISVSTTLSSVAVACGPKTNTSENSDEQNNVDNPKNSGDGTSEENTDNEDKDNEDKDIDDTDNPQLVTISLASIKSEISDLVEQENLSTLNVALADVVLNLEGVSKLEAKMLQNSKTDAEIEVTAEDGYVIEENKTSFVFENAIFQGKIIKIADVILATAPIKYYTSVDSINSRISLYAPLGTILTASAIDGSANDVNIKIETEKGFKLFGDNNYTITDALIDESNVKFDAVNNFYDTIVKIKEKFGPQNSAHEAASNFLLGMLSYSNKELIVTDSNSVTPASIKQIKVESYSNDDVDQVIISYFFAKYDEANNLVWDDYKYVYRVKVELKE